MLLAEPGKLRCSLSPRNQADSMSQMRPLHLCLSSVTIKKQRLAQKTMSRGIMYAVVCPSTGAPSSTHPLVPPSDGLSILTFSIYPSDMCAQAEKLRSKAQRPEQSRSQLQFSRYLYYLGRIRAIQLEYTDAKECLQQSARKVRRQARGRGAGLELWGPVTHRCVLFVGRASELGGHQWRTRVATS
jgi:hypothetical protein